MKTKILIFILTISLTKAFAHKDIHYHNTYGNVKIYLRTGYEYSEIYKIQITGQLAEKISNRLKFKDTILIEFIHDYLNIYDKDFYCLENNSDYKLISRFKNCKNKIKPKKGIAIRIYADKLDIVQSLKLVEYAIKNRNRLDEQLSKQILTHNNFKKSKITVKGNSKKFIDSITQNKSATWLDEILNEKIAVEKMKDNGIEIFWQKNEFIFEYKYLKYLNKAPKFLFKLKDFYYKRNVKYKEGMLVFTDATNFYYISEKENENGKQNRYISDTYMPVYVIDDFTGKIILFNDYKTFSLFLIPQNKMINDCE